MTMTISDEDGFFTFMTKQDGKEEPHSIDVLRASNAYARFSEECGGEAEALAEKWLDYLGGLGVPPMSHGAAFRVARAVLDEAEKYRVAHKLEHMREGVMTEDTATSSQQPE